MNFFYFFSMNSSSILTKFSFFINAFNQEIYFSNKNNFFYFLEKKNIFGTLNETEFSFFKPAVLFEFALQFYFYKIKIFGTKYSHIFIIETSIEIAEYNKKINIYLGCSISTCNTSSGGIS